MCNRHAQYHAYKRHPRYRHMNSDRFNKWATANAYRAGYIFPPVNFQEEDDHYIITLKVPGYSKEDFKVSLSENILSVKAELDKSEQIEFKYREFTKKSFNRQFELNEKIDTDAIKAEYVDGILNIRLEKKKDFHRTTVDIEID